MYLYFPNNLVCVYIYTHTHRVWGRGGVCTRFWLRNLRERDHWGDPDVDGRIILG